VVTLGSLVAFVGLWQAVAVFGHLGPSIFAGPGPVLQTLVRLAASGELLEHLVATGSIFFAGFGLSAISGVLIGLLLGTNEDVEAILGPYLMALYAAPRVAFVSLLLVWMGIGPSSKIALVFLSAFFPIALNTMTGARSVDAVLLRAARSYGAGRRHQFVKVVLPFSVPYILAGLRLGVGRALIGAFVAEMFGATAGIGYLIIRAGYEFRAASLLAGVLVLAACSVLLTEALRWAGHRLAPWQQDTVI
jgi:NitT/TauT family transport system permease protein